MKMAEKEGKTDLLFGLQQLRELFVVVPFRKTSRSLLLRLSTGYLELMVKRP
jgi:hypothetical protein